MEKHGYRKKTSHIEKNPILQNFGSFPMGGPYFPTWMDPSLVSTDAGPVGINLILGVMRFSGKFIHKPEPRVQDNRKQSRLFLYPRLFGDIRIYFFLVSFLGKAFGRQVAT